MATLAATSRQDKQLLVCWYMKATEARLRRCSAALLSLGQLAAFDDAAASLRERQESCVRATRDVVLPSVVWRPYLHLSSDGTGLVLGNRAAYGPRAPGEPTGPRFAGYLIEPDGAVIRIPPPPGGRFHALPRGVRDRSGVLHVVWAEAAPAPRSDWTSPYDDTPLQFSSLEYASYSPITRRWSTPRTIIRGVLVDWRTGGTLIGGRGDDLLAVAVPLTDEANQPTLQILRLGVRGVWRKAQMFSGRFVAYAAAAYLGSQSLVVAAVVDSLNYGPHLVVRTMGAGDRARDGALTQTQGADESVAGVRGQITAPVLLGLSDTLFAVWRQGTEIRFSRSNKHGSAWQPQASVGSARLGGSIIAASACGTVVVLADDSGPRWPTIVQTTFTGGSWRAKPAVDSALGAHAAGAAGGALGIATVWTELSMNANTREILQAKTVVRLPLAKKGSP